MHMELIIACSMRTNCDYFSKGHVLFVCPDVLQLLHSLVLLVGGVTRGGWSGSLVIMSSLCLQNLVLTVLVSDMSYLLPDWFYRGVECLYIDTIVDLCPGQEW